MISPEKRKRVRIGDIIEVKVRDGFAYAQYTHKHTTGVGMGELIRVFDKVFKQRPQSLQEVVQCPERFAVFVPIGVAVSRGLFTLMGNMDVAPKLQEFPTFRIGLESIETGKVAWKLTDGKKEWPVNKLTAKQRKLPIFQCWNNSALVSKINSGWLPENEV